jgi:hypothetical protein
LLITKKGAPAIYQLEHRDPSGLDPHRARPRLIQVYNPAAEAVWILICSAFRSRCWTISGAASWSPTTPVFEFAMLGSRPANLVDSMQLAGLTLGTEAGARRLANVATKRSQALRECQRATGA